MVAERGDFASLFFLCGLICELFFGFMSDKFSKKGIMIILIANLLLGSTDGASKVVDYKGFVLSEASYGESMVANGDIDLPTLRYFRNRPAMGNLLARQRFELYVESYQNTVFIHPILTKSTIFCGNTS